MSKPDFNAESSESIGFLREMIRNRPGGENRPQQEHAVLSIEKALSCEEHLLIQAGTGTGKSFATLVPAVLSGKRVVYSTATKQLSEQLMNLDIPALQKEARRQGARSFSASLLKGRDNYLCLRKYNELTGDANGSDSTKPVKQETNSLFDSEFLVDETAGEHIVEPEMISEPESKSKRGKPSAAKMKSEYDEMFKWARGTTSGDRSEAPAMSDDVWKGVSVNNNECVGKKSCPFGEQCFSEAARAEAKKVQVVITNHAVTALELTSGEEGGMLGNREVFIFDEVHEVDNFFSSAWGTVISEKIILDSLKVAKRFKPSMNIEGSWNKTIEDVGILSSDLNREMLKTEEGLIWPNPTPPRIAETLSSIHSKLLQLSMFAATSVDEAQKEQIRRTLGSVSEAIGIFLDVDEENVRWCRNESLKKEDEWTKNRRKNFKGKKTDPPPPSLHCAPMRIGPRLMNSLAVKDATMIGTSATITVGGNFDVPIHDFGLLEKLEDDHETRAFDAVDVGTPFDYAKQAMFYVPDSETFPSADYKNKEAHSAAVEEQSLGIIKALGGRTLVLTTTTKRIQEIGEYLENNLPFGSGINVLCQGDMPAPQLIEEFVRDETSVLIATMGMWHGLNAEGATCMAVLMDKIPFATADDPLATARQAYANSNKRNGFMEVYVASANVKLAQGFGRLIRTMSDRGIVAMFDTRISTKAYGRSMMRSLPNGLRTFSDYDVILGSANRLREAREAELAAK